MKSHLLHVTCVVVLLTIYGSGCQTQEQYQATKQLEERMTPEWVKANLKVGETTTDEVLRLYGRPATRTSMASSGLAGNMMPDEMWTYAIKFTESDGKFHWDPGTGIRSNVRVMSLSFKNGKLMNFTVAEH